jgi:hypothetical protein
LIIFYFLQYNLFCFVGRGSFKIAIVNHEYLKIALYLFSVFYTI